MFFEIPNRDLVSVVNFRKIVSHYYLKYVFFLILSFISFGSCSYMIVIFLILSHGPWMLYSVSAFTPGLTFILQNFNLGSFYWPVFQLSDFLLSCIKSANEPIKDILPFYYQFSKISSISFGFFLRLSIALLILPICSCMLSSPIRACNI